MAKGKKRTAAQLVVDMMANVAKLQTDMGKATQILNTFGSQVKTISKTVQASFAFDVGRTLIPKLMDLSGAISRFAAEGEKVGSIRDAFEGLGGSVSSLKAAQQAVLGTVSAFDLMAVANQGLIRGIPNFNKQFGKVAELAQRFADSSGRDTLEVLNELTDAFGSGKVQKIEKFGFALEKSKDKLKVQTEAMSQLQQVIDRLAPSLDSVANEYQALQVQLSDVGKEFGIGVNSSEELINAYKGLRSEINGTDWEGLGRSIASIDAAFINLGAQTLPTVARWINDIARGLDYLTGSSKIAQIAKIDEMLSDVQSKQETLASFSSGDVIRRADFGFSKEELDYQERILRKTRESLMQEARQADEAETARKAQIREQALQREKEFQKRREQIALESARKEAEAVEKAKLKTREQFASEMDRQNIDLLKQSFKVDFKSGNFEDAFSTLDVLKEKYKQSIIDAHKEALRAGVPLSEIEKYAGVEADKFTNELKDGVKGIGKELSRELIDATNNLFDGLDEFSQAFGLDLGKAFSAANKLLTDSQKEAVGKWFESNTGMSAGDAGAWMQAGSTVINAGVGAHKKDKADKSNEGTGAAVGAGAGAIIGGIFGGAQGAQIGAEVGNALGGMVGKLFKWGPTNPETIARHSFANFVEEGFKKLGQVSFFDAQGKLKNTSGKNFNFLEGGTGKFNDPEWAKKMDSWGAEAKQTFIGLGEALKEVQGITEDVGGQIAFVLGENLSGNIDNARLLVQQLGLSFDDLSAALEKSAVAGTISWHEFEVQLQGVAEAFKPGLAAFGDVAGAVDEIVQSGGRGQAAVKGIKDLAQETKDLGGSTIEDLKRFMEQQGVAADLIDSITQSLDARKITSIDQILNLNPREAGGIIAEIYSNNSKLAKQWDEMGEKLKGITDTLKEMDSQLEKELTISVKTNLDSATADAIKAGVFDGTGLESAVSQMKAAGKINVGTVRNLGGGSGKDISAGARANLAPVTINMDLRGAQAGVSAEMHNAIASMEARVVQRTLNAVYDGKARGSL